MEVINEKISDLRDLGMDASQFCGFRIGSNFYAIPVQHVQEVIKNQRITGVPLSESHIRGLISLRGQVVTSVSLRTLFGLEEDFQEDHMNIIVRHDEALIALAVDQIEDIVELKRENFETTPDTLDPKIKDFIMGVYKEEKDLIIILDLEKVLALT